MDEQLSLGNRASVKYWSCTVLLVLWTQLQGVSSGVGWAYYSAASGLKPDQWAQSYPDCDGRMQSPIEINSEEVLYDPNLAYFNLSDYSKVSGIKLELINQGGHTAEVMYRGEPVYITGGGLPDRYKLSQYHFHWGSDNSKGSEHGFDGRHFPVEMHLVHFQDHFKNSSAAASRPSGLAVIGFFFEIGDHNMKFDQLLAHFSKIEGAGNATEIPTFPLSDLLPSGYLDFFRYQGSLTTPPCHESVIWSIATEPIIISQEQMNIFRGLHDEDDNLLVNDYRPVQNRNDRTVLTTKSSFNSSPALTVSMATLLLAAILGLVAHRV